MVMVRDRVRVRARVRIKSRVRVTVRVRVRARVRVKVRVTIRIRVRTRVRCRVRARARVRVWARVRVRIEKTRKPESLYPLAHFTKKSGVHATPMASWRFHKNIMCRKVFLKFTEKHKTGLNDNKKLQVR